MLVKLTKAVVTDRLQNLRLHYNRSIFLTHIKPK